MNKVTNSLISLLIALIAPCYGMDVEQKQPEKTYLPTIPMPSGEEFVSKMPPEILEHILTFVIANDPDAIGNLARIQEVCKGLAGFLSKDEIKWILELTQEDINHLLERTILPFKDGALPNPQRIQLLFNLGAKLGAYQVRKAIFETISTALQYLVTMGNDLFVKNNALTKMFEVIEILEQHSATYDDINNYTDLLTSSISSQFPVVAKFLLDHGMIPTEKSLKAAIILNPALIELILKAGIQPTRNHLADAVQNDLTNITSMLLKAGAQPETEILSYAIFREKDPEIIKSLIEYGADVNAIGGYHFIAPPLAYAQTAQVAKILLQAGAQISLSCTETSGIELFKHLIQRAIEEKNPAVLVEVLKQRYAFKTALAIATALIAGAPYFRAACNIL